MKSIIPIILVGLAVILCFTTARENNFTAQTSEQYETAMKASETDYCPVENSIGLSPDDDFSTKTFNPREKEWEADDSVYHNWEDGENTTEGFRLPAVRTLDRTDLPPTMMSNTEDINSIDNLPKITKLKLK